MKVEHAGRDSDRTQVVLTPTGVLVCIVGDEEMRRAFALGEVPGLMVLSRRSDDRTDGESVRYWRSIAQEFIRRLCHIPDGVGEDFAVPEPDAACLGRWVLEAPPMVGGEYLSAGVLLGVWQRLEKWAREEIRAEGSIARFLDVRAPEWSRVGRVTFHLAENRGDEAAPFAFLATYASGLNAAGRVRQLPLGKALKEYGGAGDRAVLLKLLEPLHRASQASRFLAELVESGDVYHPLAWSPREAYAFLQSVPLYEEAGLLVKLPNWWKKRGRRPMVTATIGEKRKSQLGLEALLDFKLEVVVDGQALGCREVAQLLACEEGLVLFRGEWIEVNREKLREALEHWKALEAVGDVSLAEGMRLLAGASEREIAPEDEDDARAWAFARPGKWLEETLRALTDPKGGGPPPTGLKARLRPYQEKGLEWLWFCARAGLGGCLADDMGLGKTIQILAALQRKKEASAGGAPSLLVVPASLIGNWKREAARFTPGLRVFVVHRSEENGEAERLAEVPLDGNDLIITTYGALAKLDWLSKVRWGWVVLDEAQAIKNHGTRQSRAVRELRADVRFALTGTPVENHLGDLWALFDFLNPGLLGTKKEFGDFCKRLRDRDGGHYGPLRRLVGPYILRRLKTDRAIISDLPEKTEMKVFCGLTAVQAKAYRQTAAHLKRELAQSSGIQRRGLVLAYLMRFKQICNHPDQLTKVGDYDPGESAKFGRLAELCGEMASRGEKALVFTQFRELTEPLAGHLESVFGREGLVLHGGTAVRARQEMVERFQREDGPPFFVLSLKAGGTGLNLTAASHVIHFDRWWNPAVENQATDRAFRIGQKRNVFVHKFITSGTLEEKIDAMLVEKQGTADAIFEGGAEKALTEMGNSELLDFIRLDLQHAESIP